MGFKIGIIVNGLSEKVPEGATLEDLVKLFNELDPDLIVEHNGRFIYPHEYGSTSVSENDRVEFINPNLGG
jgi:thiamine biosynthesis protein ThiS